QPDKIFLRERWRTVAVGVVGVQREEAIDRSIRLPPQSALDSLADHRPLLSRHGKEVCLDFRKKFTAKGDVDVLARPRRAFAGAVAKLEMLDIERLRKPRRFLDQRALGVR